MSKWYRVSRTGWLEEKEIASHTDKFVVFPNGRKEKKSNSWDAWFPTRKEAVQWLIDLRRGEYNAAVLRLENAKKLLAEAEARLSE